MNDDEMGIELLSVVILNLIVLATYIAAWCWMNPNTRIS
jgi:hypothetical protein